MRWPGFGPGLALRVEPTDPESGEAVACSLLSGGSVLGGRVSVLIRHRHGFPDREAGVSGRTPPRAVTLATVPSGSRAVVLELPGALPPSGTGEDHAIRYEVDAALRLNDGRAVWARAPLDVRSPRALHAPLEGRVQYGGRLPSPADQQADPGGAGIELLPDSWAVRPGEPVTGTVGPVGPGWHHRTAVLVHLIRVEARSWPPDAALDPGFHGRRRRVAQEVVLVAGSPAPMAFSVRVPADAAPTALTDVTWLRWFLHAQTDGGPTARAWGELNVWSGRP